MPVSVEGQRAVFRLKNRFCPGDALELMQPGQPPYAFAATRVWDENGETPEIFHHPEMRFAVEFPFVPDEFSILRRQKPVVDK
ncbi:MAG TPA: U32 family peptidase C-terminal domain-containing protein, partial [Candidatus Lawsonibacter pullicola]|nr:U32 family peptidase C-terminal domain-containing protein [Candidatus Lawsonibacter pullicola]